MTAAACRLLDIDLIIRAHQVVQDGYEVASGRQLLTIFSAPNYAGQFNNAAAVACVDKDLEVSGGTAGDQPTRALQITFQQMRNPPTPQCKRAAPPCAADKAEPTPKTIKLPSKPAAEPAQASTPTKDDTKPEEPLKAA